MPASPNRGHFISALRSCPGINSVDPLPDINQFPVRCAFSADHPLQAKAI